METDQDQYLANLAKQQPREVAHLEIAGVSVVRVEKGDESPSFAFNLAADGVALGREEVNRLVRGLVAIADLSDK